ncbi:hypothetical protein CQA65_30585, partial [Klebsiella pneumoniae]
DLADVMPEGGRYPNPRQRILPPMISAFGVTLPARLSRSAQRTGIDLADVMPEGGRYPNPRQRILPPMISAFGVTLPA